MFQKSISIIFIGLSIVAAMLVLGYTVFVKQELSVPVEPLVVSDNEIVSDDDVLKIDTSDWKTHRNEEFGFEMRYPEDWDIFIEEYESRWHETVLGRIVISGSAKDPFYAPLSITIRSNEEKLSIKGWYQKNYPNGDISRLQEVRFDKTNGIRVLSLWSDGLDGFYFSNEDKIYSVSIMDLQENAENQIMMNEKLLSTLEFIKS